MKSFIKYLYSKCLQILLFPFCLFPIQKNRLAFTGLTVAKDMIIPAIRDIFLTISESRRGHVRDILDGYRSKAVS